MRRKTRPRVVWLPNTLEFAIGDDSRQSTYSQAIHDLNGPAAGDAVVSLHAITIDAPADPLVATSTLSDIENSGYRLRRIVGKIWCSMQQSVAGPFGPATVICTAAFIILRVDPGGAPLNAAVEAYGPNIIDTNDSPWIWRRSWILNDRSQNVNSFFGGTQGSDNLGGLGGVADGPHVDAKTARNVGHDERLFLALSTTAMVPGTEGIDSRVKWVWDPRVLATLRTTSGNRRNASR